MTAELGKKIGVIGVGWVGGAVSRYFQGAGHEVLLYDPPKGHADIGVLAAADAIFVCVPTPFDPQHGGYISAYIDEAVAKIPGSKTVIIKSTVVPGTTASLQERFPQHRFMFNPEFLREKTATEDFLHPDRQIIGVTAASAGEAEAILKILPAAPFSKVVNSTEAETVKYFGNCFLALKVVFANQFYDVCAKLGIDYDAVKDCAAADPRIGPGHLQIFTDGYRGYGGGCFPKDVKTFAQFGDRIGLDLELLKTCDRINERLVSLPKK
ncbi:MAG: hypothetical protein WCT10_04920 [Patescibacteria group bacterium]|jgi:UDPglucose 6-dehydrogenase